MIEYHFTEDSRNFSFSYKDLREKYILFKEISDEEFVHNIMHVIHFACLVSWIKEIGLDASLSDVGIVHELVHIAITPEESRMKSLREVREDFNKLMKLD